MTYLGKGNSKYKKMGWKVRTFGIPAYRSVNHQVTCPAALHCVAGCYARQGRYVMPSVQDAEERRLLLTTKPEFVETIINEVRRYTPAAVRIHDAGDFYSIGYLRRWLKIIQASTDTTFFAYTKMIPFFKRDDLIVPKNLVVIFSEGGKFDHWINPDRDRWSRVFPSHAALEAEGFADATHDDRVAVFGPNSKIGLVYHGFASKAFHTMEVK